MKIDFIIISGILVIISFLPFILMPILGMKNQKNLTRTFREESLKLGLNISFKLQWNTNIAGIDIMNKHFLFIQRLDNNLKIKHIDLNQVNEVKLVTKTCEFKVKEKFRQSLSQVDLEFYQPNSEVPVTVNLFDYDLNYTEDLEIKNSQKLLVELQKYVNAVPVLKHTA